MKTDLSKIFIKMKQSSMRNWVGDGDPEIVGKENFKVILEHIPLKANGYVLDFGCGIGRTSAPLAAYLTAGFLVGIDIIDSQIKFCCDILQASFKNTDFYCFNDANPHYPKSKNNQKLSIDRQYFIDRYPLCFDLAVNFSVFTHFNPEMLSSYLELQKVTLKNSGFILGTFFLNLPTNPAGKILSQKEYFRDCDDHHPLLFALYDIRLVQDIAKDLGLAIRKIVYGTWRNSRKIYGSHFQDIIIFEKVNVLPDDFDAEKYVSLYPDLQRAKVNGKVHYIENGFYENRKYK